MGFTDQKTGEGFRLRRGTPASAFGACFSCVMCIALEDAIAGKSDQMARLFSEHSSSSWSSMALISSIIAWASGERRYPARLTMP